MRKFHPQKYFRMLANSIWQRPLRWLIGVTILTVFFIIGIPRIRYEFDYTRFYPQDSEVTRFYDTFQSTFADDPQWLWVLPETEGSAFATETLIRIDSLSKMLDTIAFVDDVQSITRAEIPIRDVFGFRTERPYRNGHISPFDSARLMNIPMVVNQLVSEDGMHPALVIRWREEASKEAIHKRIPSVEKVVSQVFPEYHISGRYWAEHLYNEMLKSETTKGIIGSVIIMTLMLWLLFRRVGSIILPALAISTGVAMFFGLKGWSGWPLDILGVLFPPLLLIVGLSDVVHLYAKIQWKLAHKNTLKKSIQEAWAETGYATFLTSTTTGIGFLSLVTADIIPIQEFGLQASIAVLIMYLACLVFIPIFLRTLPFKSLQPKPATHQSWKKAGKAFFAISSHTWYVPITLVIVVAASLFGVVQIRTAVPNFWQINDESTLKRDLEFMDTHFGGARFLDMGVRRADGSPIDSEQDFYVTEALAEKIRESGIMGQVLAASDPAASLEMARMGGLPQYFGLSSSASQLRRDLSFIQGLDSSAYHLLVSTDDRWMRISGRMKNVDSDSALAITHRISEWLTEISPDHMVYFTGYSILMDANNEILVENMFQSLALAFVVIAILMMILFGSLRMLALSLLPNVLPLLVALGLMGWLHIPLGNSTALILTVGFVIAVDDTIHYLMKFRILFRQTGRLRKSVYDTNVQVGRALTLSSAVMLAAFTPQFFSAFLEQVYFGILISGVLISALWADIFFLPWLLLKFFRIPKQFKAVNQREKGRPSAPSDE